MYVMTDNILITGTFLPILQFGFLKIRRNLAKVDYHKFLEHIPTQFFALPSSCKDCFYELFFLGFQTQQMHDRKSQNFSS
jgi:hypothetical protein